MAPAEPVRTPSRRRSRLRGAFVAVLLLWGWVACALDEAQVDFAVLAELSRLGLHEYAELLAGQMESRYPERRAEVLVEKARALYAAGKTAQAEEALAAVRPENPHYPQAVLLRAEEAARRGQDEAAAAAYAEFFDKTRAPSPDDRRRAERYTRAVAAYSAVLRRLGRGAEAATVLDRLGKSTGADDRKLKFLKAQALLDTEEARLESGKPLQRETVQTALAQLRELQFLRDGVAAAACLETARAHILLAGEELNTLRQGKRNREALLQIKGFQQALDTLRAADESDLLRDVEKEVVRGRDPSASPYAGALFYKAEAYRGMALAQYLAGEEKQSRKLARAAARLLETVIADYGDSEYRNRALARHEKCNAFLEQAFGERVPLAEGSAETELAVRLEQALALVQTRDYRGALPISLEAVRLARRSRRLPDAARCLILCLADAGRFLEAQAVAAYVAEAMPGSEGAADCLFRLGGLLYEKAKTLDGDAREAMLADAMAVWEQFAESAPEHPRAAEVCFAVAEDYYRRASESAARGREKPGAPEGPLSEEARQAFLAAVPRYRRLVERYGSQAKGVRALYKLGWVYSRLGQTREAADAFLRYAETETSPQYAEDRLEAAFRGAEQLMLGDAPGDAVEHFRQLLAALQPGNADAGRVAEKTASRLREDAASCLAWACDLAAEKTRPAVLALRERLADSERRQRAAADAVRADQERLQALAQEREELRRHAADLEQALTAVDLDFAAQAAARLAQHPDAQTDAARLAAELEAQARTRALAEVETRRADQETLAGQRRAHQDLRTDLEARLAAAVQAETEAQNALTAVVDRLRVLREAAAAAEREVVEGEAACREAEDELRSLQERRAEADPNARNDLEARIRDLAAKLAAAREKAAEACRRRDQSAGPAAQQEMAELEARSAGAEEALREAADARAAAEEARRLAVLEGQILEARAAASARALDAAMALAAALEQPPGPARAAAQPRLAAKAREAAAAFAHVHELEQQRVTLQEEAAQARIQAAQTRLAQRAAQAEALRARLKPLEDEMLEWKRKAAAAFEEFLQACPASRHVPRNLARLGAVYLDLQQYDRAAGILDRLDREFAGTEAAREALFSLGRARWEQGKYDEAAETFRKLLREPAALSVPSLAFISERLLEHGDAAVSLAASRELLARTAPAAGGPPRVREQALFRAGQACLALKACEDALEHFSSLLAEFPRTGYFFDARFGMAEARRCKTPPDPAGALADLGEVIRFAQDQAQTNRALCLTGETLLDQGDPRSTQQAAARFQQVVLLADPVVPGNAPWLERAIAGSARAFHRLGQTADRDAMTALYRQRFPDGPSRPELDALAAAPAPEAAQDRASPPPRRKAAGRRTRPPQDAEQP